MENASDHLAGLVLAVEYVLDPEAIFFGGRLSDRILKCLMERVGKKLPVAARRRQDGGAVASARDSRRGRGRARGGDAAHLRSVRAGAAGVAQEASHERGRAGGNASGCGGVIGVSSE